MESQSLTCIVNAVNCVINVLIVTNGHSIISVRNEVDNGKPQIKSRVISIYETLCIDNLITGIKLVLVCKQEKLA